MQQLSVGALALALTLGATLASTTRHETSFDLKLLWTWMTAVGKARMEIDPNGGD